MGLAVALGAPAAFAQDTMPPAGVGTPAPPVAPTPTPTVGGTVEGTLPPPKVAMQTPAEPAAARKVADEDDGVSDHEKVIGHLGVGYLGLTNLPIAGAIANGGLGRAEVAAPVIGVRYWLNERLGLDLGLGLAITAGSTEVVQGPVTTSTDAAGIFGGVVHGGVPIVLGHQKHYKFLVVPEVNIGFATSTETPANAPVGTGDISHTGFHLDLGGRVGTEVHFGFIGVPQLSLQASVGLAVRHDSVKWKQDVANQTNSASVSETKFGTSVQGDPWAIFVNNISAIYYMP